MSTYKCGIHSCSKPVNNIGDRFCSSCFVPPVLVKVIHDFETKYNSKKGSCYNCNVLQCDLEKNERYCSSCLHEVKKRRENTFNNQYVVAKTKEKCEALEERLRVMEDRITDLENALRYAPGSSAFQQAENRWNDFIKHQ